MAADPQIWNQEPPEALANLVGNFQKSFPNSYDYAKTFVQTASSAAGGGNGVTSLDDPTYLGFNIRFDIMSPLFAGALEGNPAIPLSQDPTSFTGGGADELGSHPSGESAVGYLNKVGETNRATYLTAFAQGLREIQQTRPYYFQTIEGLQEAWNKTVTMTPYNGSGDGEGITVGLLEAIDLKMSALFSLYKAACYDVKYRRTILPINLMYFNCYVDVVEIRKFRSTGNLIRNFINSQNPNSPENELNKFVNENASMMTFKFEECLWDLNATGQVFANVANDGSNSLTTSSMKWQYGKVEIESQFAGYDSALKDTANLKPKTYGDLAKAAGKKFLDKQLTGATNLIQRKAAAFAQGLKFGNAFGLRNDIINAVQNPQGLLSTLQGAAAQELTTPGFDPSIAKVSENIFGEGPPEESSLQSSNLFPEEPAEKEFNSSNAFGPAPSGPPPLESQNLFE